MDLAEMLTGMVTEDGLSVALVVGRDGLLVEGQSRNNSLDLQAVGALATRAVADLDHLQSVLHGGAATRLRLRFEHFELLVEPVTDSDILVAGVSSATEGESLLDAAARYRKDLRQLLGGL